MLTLRKGKAHVFELHSFDETRPSTKRHCNLSFNQLYKFQTSDIELEVLSCTFRILDLVFLSRVITHQKKLVSTSQQRKRKLQDELMAYHGVEP